MAARPIDFSGFTTPQIIRIDAIGRAYSSRVERALKKSEDLLAATGRMAKVGGWELDPETLEVTWTDEVYRIHEVPVGQNPPLDRALEFFHPDDRKKLALAIKRALELGEPYDMEVRFRTAKGRDLWTHTICKPVVVDGRTVKLLGTFQDITERKQAEQAVRKGEAQRRLIATSVQDGIIMLDSRGNVTLWNEAAEKMFGYPATEVEGRPLHELIIPERHREAHIRGWERFQKAGDGRMIDTRVELEALRADGTEFPVELSIGAVKQGTDWDAVGLVRDISERKAMHRLLVSNEERLRSIIEDQADGVVVVGVEGDILFVNPAAAEILGRDRKDLVGSDSKFVRALADEGDIELQRPDGTCVSASMRSRDMDWLGQRARLVSIHDITARQDLERARLKSSQELKETLMETIRAIALTIEKRDPCTGGHQQRVSRLASAIAVEMGLASDKIEGLRLGALIHDIGKLAVPSDILNRPGRLTKTEMRLIETHPRTGYEIVKEIDFPWRIGEIVLQHHERLDGSGYPDGLRKGEIVEEALIVAVADVVEAMNSHRPYRPAYGIDAALDEITRNRGILYDPDVVDACVHLFQSDRFSF